MYSDDSFIWLHLFQVDMFGLASFPDYRITH